MRPWFASRRLRAPLTARLYNRALTEGLLRGDGRWRGVLYTMWAWRLLKRIVIRRPQTVAVERLRPGQTVIVTGTSRR